MYTAEIISLNSATSLHFVFPLSVMGSKTKNDSRYMYSYMSKFSDSIQNSMHEFGHISVKAVELKLTLSGL